MDTFSTVMAEPSSFPPFIVNPNPLERSGLALILTDFSTYVCVKQENIVVLLKKCICMTFYICECTLIVDSISCYIVREYQEYLLNKKSIVDT